MRKFLGVSFAAILAVAPMVARAADDPTTPIAPVTIAANETVGVASTKYVKEAYNAMAGKVNAELAKKQDVIDADHKLAASNVSGLATVATSGKSSDLNNDAGFITKDVNNLTNYTTTTNMNTALNAKVTNEGQFTGNTDSSLIKSKTVVNAIKDTATAVDGKVTNAGQFTANTNSDLIKNKTVVEAIQSTATAVDGKQAALTETQLAAVNSGINSTRVATYDAFATGKQDKLTEGDGIDITNNTIKVDLSANSGLAFDATDKKLELSSATKASLGKADNAVRMVKVNGTALSEGATDGDVNITVATGTGNGTIKVNGADVSVKGLGSAAYTESTAYATSAQGTKADNAVRMVKVNGTALEEGATDGDVNITVATGTGNGTIKVNGADVSVKGLGSAAYTESTAYATSAQGTKADNAALAIGTGTLNTTATTLIGAVNEVNGKVLTIYSGWNNGGTPGTTSTVTLTTPAS